MAIRHQAPALAGIEIDSAEPVEQRDKIEAGAASTTSGNHQHPACRPKEVNRFGYLREIRARDRTRLGMEMLFELQRLWHNSAQRVGRKVDVRPSGLATLAESACYRLVEFLQHEGGFAHGARVARDGSNQLRVIHILQAAAIFLRAGIAT